MGMGGQHHAPASFTPGKDPLPIVQEAGWTSEPVWRSAENLVPTGIGFPDLPAGSESLEAVVTSLKLLSQTLSGVTELNHEQLRTALFKARFETSISSMQTRNIITQSTCLVSEIRHHALW